MAERPISAVIERWRERAALALYRVATTLDPKPRVEIDRRDGEPPDRAHCERLRCAACGESHLHPDLAQCSITGGYDDQ